MYMIGKSSTSANSAAEAARPSLYRDILVLPGTVMYIIQYPLIRPLLVVWTQGDRGPQLVHGPPPPDYA